MPVAKDGDLTTVAIVVPKRIDTAIRAEHADLVAAHVRRHGTTKGAPKISSVWVRYITAGLNSAADDRLTTDPEKEVA